MEIKTRSRVVILSGVLYLLAGCFLITTAALFTAVIMHQYAYDGRYGPHHGHAISKCTDINCRNRFKLTNFRLFRVKYREFLHKAFDPMLMTLARLSSKFSSLICHF